VPTWVPTRTLVGRSLPLCRGCERFHSAVPDCIGSVSIRPRRHLETAARTESPARCCRRSRRRPRAESRWQAASEEEAICQAAESFEIPPERQNRIVV